MRFRACTRISTHSLNISQICFENRQTKIGPIYWPVKIIKIGLQGVIGPRFPNKNQSQSLARYPKFALIKYIGALHRLNHKNPGATQPIFPFQSNQFNATH